MTEAFDSRLRHFFNFASDVFTIMTWSGLLKRAWREDEGQDLVEYGILIALVVVGSVALFPSIATRMGLLLSSAPGSWNDAVQNIWIPNDPVP